MKPRPRGSAPPVHIRVVGDIGGPNGFSGFGAAKLVRASPLSSIHLEIDSFGGEVGEGLELLDALADHPHRVMTKVIGHAHSMAAILALAGDLRLIKRTGSILFHRPELADRQVFRLEDLSTPALAKIAADIESTTELLVSIVARSYRNQHLLVRAWFDSERLFDAATAVRTGLVHGLISDRAPEPTRRRRVH